jgi:hypothetical protein
MRASFALLLLFALACAPDADQPQAPPTDGSGPVIIGPGTRPGGGAGGAGGDAGAGGEGGQGGAAGPRGACVGDSDLDALDASAGGRTVAAGCAVNFVPACNPNDSVAYAGCISRCVARRIPGLSTGCSLCYGAAQACALDNTCTAACNLNACGRACLDCLGNAGCLDSLDACTGLDFDECALPSEL